MSRNRYLPAVYAFIAVFACIAFVGCGKSAKSIDTVTAKVIKVKNGNTIELDNGLTVHLLGVKNNAQTENYLKTVALHKTITLKADQKSAKAKSYKKSNDQVWAYAMLKDDGKVIPLNGTMIRQGISEVDRQFVGDSLKAFLEEKPLPDKMDYPALKAKMLPATFMILAADGSQQWHGTGFYISENGLALTNNHVLNLDVAQALVSMPNSNGRIDGTRNRGITKILYTDPELDYTIFQVTLDPGEKVPYLPVTRQQAVVPEEIGVLGNPLNDDAMFTTGTVSQIFDERGKIGVTADIAPGNSGGPICDMRGQVVGIAQSVAVSVGAPPKYGVDIMRVREVLNNHSDIPTYAGK